MTQYQQLKAVINWLAGTFGTWAQGITPDQLTEFLQEGTYGSLSSVNDYDAFADEYDLEALAEFWNEGNGWTFADLIGLFD